MYIVLIVILAGLWFFRRWARTTYVVIFVFSIVSGLFRQAPVFVSSAVLTLATVSRALDAVMITVTFLPPLREAFAKRTA